MINNEGVLLPIGTIVVLKDGYKKLMIIGRMQLQGKEEKLWDYLGILYPEGYLGEGYTFLFNKYCDDGRAPEYMMFNDIRVLRSYSGNESTKAGRNSDALSGAGKLRK